MQLSKITLPAACLVALAMSTIVAAPSARGNALNPSQKAVLPTPSQRFGDLQKAEDPSFRKHVIPLLARAGCSARECHGSFQGRGGFQLSLFGSEWEADFIQLTQKKGGEDEIRVNLKEPEHSLILMKPTVQMKHKGKERFKKDSWQYNMILKWVRGGIKNDFDKTGELQRLEVTPAEIVFGKPGQAVQLQVLAHWKDGSVEDVTEITRFKTNDETVANVSEAGLVSCTGKGDSHVVISYDNGVVPIPVMLAVSEFNGSKFPVSQSRTKIDGFVQTKLQKVGIIPSEVCTDSEFLRRVSLDLTGTLPSTEEVTQFLADKSPTKRTAKIDELLKTPSYAAYWATKMCDYTGNNAKQINLGGQMNRGYGEVARMWYEWFNKRIAENMPYDKMVEGVVLATSRSTPEQSYKDYVLETDSYFRTKNPTDYANHPTMPFYWQRRAVASPDEKALAFSHTFLGVRLECAQCHKHPFDRWTKNDFKEFSAFFNSVAVGNKAEPKGSTEISYATINKELKETVEAAFEKTDGTSMKEKEKAKDKDKSKEAVAVAVAGKDKKDVKKDVKKDQRLRNAIYSEVARRINAGEMVPWAEVFANTNGSKVIGGKGGKGVKIDTSIQPKVLGGEFVNVPKGTDSRQPLMDWLRSKSNPYFAKAIVNRVWASYFNRGIVDPPDDMNIANAPANTELLNYLAEEFVAHGYDLKWLHRGILSSDTYQRSWKVNATNALDARNFSHAVVRQLPAEVMLDAIDMAVGSDSKRLAYASNMEVRAIGPVGMSATAKPGKGGGGANQDTYFLTLFGKPARVANCDCERSADPTLLQTLFTRNDPNLLSRIEGNGSFLAELRKSTTGRNATKLDTDKTITQVFLRTVSRPPSAQELAQARTDIASAKEPVEGVRDLVWAMINTREFKVNH